MFVQGHSLQWYVLRTNAVTNEVTRGQKVHIFDLSQNLEYRYKRPYQGQEPTNIATFTPKYVRLGTLLLF